MATQKTMEDWFLRGGEKPTQDSASGDPDAHGGGFPPGSPHESDADDGSDEEVLRDWTVMMSRMRSVQQTAKVRVEAHGEEEAMEVAEGLAVDEQDQWDWEDDDDTEEFNDARAVMAGVAP